MYNITIHIWESISIFMVNLKFNYNAEELTDGYRIYIHGNNKNQCNKKHLNHN